ncbi:MAG: glycoside hydrolase family 5 protein [Treponema sp.]|nr:glycoside hydrolase family 5 protein [Treponema sp.]
MKVLFLMAAVILAACSSTEQGASGAPQRAAEPIVVPKETGPVDAVMRSTPFSRGVNFSGWFESFSAQSIPFTKYSEQDFANVKSLGADVVRLPVRMHSMTDGSPNYRLDPLLLKFLDFAVDWAEKHEIYLIIDNHSFDPVAKTKDDTDTILVPVWEQIARRYKDRSDLIVYEILNEPHGISDKRWGEIQGLAIDAIRRHDKKHAIIVGGTEYNSIGKLNAIPRYSDDNLIYTFHFYDPYLFTHQGASWGSPPVLTTLAAVPFPADRRRMPKIPDNLKGTWIENSLNNSYWHDASPAALYVTLNKTVAFSRERNVPVFCGEFGVYLINCLPEDRVRWYDFVTDAMERRNISRTSWDYYGGFGIFNSEGRGDFNSDLNVDIVRALGFTPPAQMPRIGGPLESGFYLYDDYPNRVLSAGSWGNNTDFSLYDTKSASGDFAIRWANADQYNVFWFGFDKLEDFSNLLEAGFKLEFTARTEKPVQFDIRFVNPESHESIPWRMRYTIDDKILPPDGKWHTVSIPLSQMKEHGAWVNAKQEWIGPKGEFSWKKIKQLEFVAEYGNMKDLCVWFDSIEIKY